MAELVVVAVVVGILLLAAWPLARMMTRRRTPQDQGKVTSTSQVPPRDPSAPLPGSRADRERHGKP